MNPNLPVLAAQTLESQQSGPVEGQLRIAATVAGSMGVVGLMLAAIGIYGVVAYTVSHRTAEIGVRIALGATAARVVRQILEETLTVVGIGAAIGWMMAFLVAIHVVRGGPINLTIFIGVPAILMLVAAGACWLPARRAARVDPVVALRAEN